MAFRGTFDHSLDAKNRLTVPAPFRAALADGVVIAKGEDECVALWRPADYDEHISEVASRGRPGTRDRRDAMRFYSANARDVDLDAANRVTIPAFLMEHGGLRKDVTIIGAGDWIEVWDAGRWNAYSQDLDSRIPDLTESLDHPA